MEASDAAIAKRTACAVSASYLIVQSFYGARAAEDLIDLLHSCYSTRASVRAVASTWVEHHRRRPAAPTSPRASIIHETGPAIFDAWERNRKKRQESREAVEPPAPEAAAGLLVLPSAADVEARHFLVASTSYFVCDAVLVSVQLARGVRPHQWAGRLAHHVIQLCANLPALFSSPRVGRTVRTYLMCAYLAVPAAALESAQPAEAPSVPGVPRPLHCRRRAASCCAPGRSCATHPTESQPVRTGRFRGRCLRAFSGRGWSTSRRAPS